MRPLRPSCRTMVRSTKSSSKKNPRSAIQRMYSDSTRMTPATAKAGGPVAAGRTTGPTPGLSTSCINIGRRRYPPRCTLVRLLAALRLAPRGEFEPAHRQASQRNALQIDRHVELARHQLDPADAEAVLAQESLNLVEGDPAAGVVGGHHLRHPFLPAHLHGNEELAHCGHRSTGDLEGSREIAQISQNLHDLVPAVAQVVEGLEPGPEVMAVLRMPERPDLHEEVAVRLN